jgi:hypothetical protein
VIREKPLIAGHFRLTFSHVTLVKQGKQTKSPLKSTEISPKSTPKHQKYDPKIYIFIYLSLSVAVSWQNRQLTDVSQEIGQLNDLFAQLSVS